MMCHSRMHSIRTKLICAFLFVSALLLISNFTLFYQVNKSIRQINNIYISNTNLTVLSESLNLMHDCLYEFLNTKSDESLTEYYEAEQEYETQVSTLNSEIIDNRMAIMERNIRNMSMSYIDLAEQSIYSRRGQNVKQYKSCFELANINFEYINDSINELNILQFENNSQKYQVLLESLNYLEVVSSVILIVVALTNIIFLVVFSTGIVRPLKILAHNAGLVAKGNFDIQSKDPKTYDEVAIVTIAFNQMAVSLKEYIIKTKENIELEKAMKEHELMMEMHLKEAQLNYLQSQIDPHFLFNSLNIGVQLAILENADRTSLFLDKMAEYFRYNAKKINEEATIEEEIHSVESYIYIVNVRFADNIKFVLDADNKLYSNVMPSMILQPLVENAIKYGVSNIERQGIIMLKIHRMNERIKISVEDNGIGMSNDQIESIMSGGQSKKHSSGIGINNVRSRINLKYGNKGDFWIESDGVDKGTKVFIIIPGGDNNIVQNINC